MSVLPVIDYSNVIKVDEESYKIEWQFNEKCNVQKLGRKPTQDELKELNQSWNWGNKEAPLELFYHYILTGNTIRLGIKKGGNKQEHFAYATGFALDFDDLTDMQAYELMGHEMITVRSLIVYTTPSFNAAINDFSCRAVFLFDRKVDDWKFAEKLILTAMWIIDRGIEDKINTDSKGIDKMCFDPGRIFYTNLNQDEEDCFLSRTSTILSIDWLTQYIPDWVHQKVDNTNKGKAVNFEDVAEDELTANKIVTNHIRKNLIEPRFNSDFLGFYEWLCNEFDCYFKMSIHSSKESQAVNTYRGTNPLPELAEKANSGTGFCISEMEDGTITWNQNGLAGVDGDLVSLIHYMKNHETLDPKNPEDRKAWKQTAREFCKLVEIDPPPLGKNRGLIVIDSRRGGRVAVEKDNAKRLYGYNLDDIWYDGLSLYVWNGAFWEPKSDQYFKSKLQEVFFAYTSMTEEGEVKLPLATSQQIAEGLNALKNHCAYEPVDRLEKILTLQNGDLIIVDGEWHLVPHQKDHYSKHQLLYGFDDTVDDPEFLTVFRGLKDDGSADRLRSYLAKGLNPKEFSRSKEHGYNRALLLIGMEGRNGKDSIRKLYELTRGQLGSIGLSAYNDAANGNPFGIADIMAYDFHWKSETPGKIRFGKLKDLISDITGDERDAQRKHKDVVKVRYEGILVFNMNEHWITDTENSYLVARYDMAHFDKTFDPSLETDVDPNNPNRLKGDPKYESKEYHLGNCPSFLNHLLQRYQQLWKGEVKLDYTHVKVYMSQRAQEAKHVKQFIVDAEYIYDPTSKISGSRLLTEYHFFCLKEGKATGHVTCVDKRVEANGRDVSRLEELEYDQVKEAVIDQIIDDNRFDPVSRLKGFYKKLQEDLDGKVSVSRNMSTTSGFKKNEQVITGLRLARKAKL